MVFIFEKKMLLLKKNVAVICAELEVRPVYFMTDDVHFRQKDAN